MILPAHNTNGWRKNFENFNEFTKIVCFCSPSALVINESLGMCAVKKARYEVDSREKKKKSFVLEYLSSLEIELKKWI